MRGRCLAAALLVACLVAGAGLACSQGQNGTDAGAAASPVDPTTTTLAPANWRNLAPNGAAPTALLGATLVCLPSGGRLLLFGGWAGAGAYSASTWVYDPASSTWGALRLQGIGPAPRASHTFVYDTASGKVILFGGFDGVSYYNDTWAYDPATNAWANLRPTGSVPAKRSGHSMVYDPASKRMILFGGWNGRVDYNDTWAYDPAANTWTNLTPTGPRPAARDSHAMAYDSGQGIMILFGGWNTEREFQDTWAYDPDRNVWTDLAPAGEIPSSRALEQMVYDAGAGQLVIFGGGSGAEVFNDTWYFDTTTRSWSLANLSGRSPEVRTGYAMAYDPEGVRVVLFGGYNGSTFLNDLWVLAR